MLCAFCINLVLNQVLRALYVRENKRRDQAVAGRSEEEMAAMKRESELRGFEDATDKNNVSALQRYPVVQVCGWLNLIGRSCSVTYYRPRGVSAARAATECSTDWQIRRLA